MVSVVMIGATGAVGGAALAELMAAPEVSRITVLGRRAVAVTHPKLRQAVVDLAVPDSYAAHLAGHDVAICTLGVGQPTKTDRTTFLAVDQAMPRAFATACRAAGVARFVLLGSVGANARSPSFYLRSKGELEEALAAMGFAGLSLFQPSMILTPENRYGLSQAITLAVWPRLTPLLAGPLRKYRGIAVADLGRAIARTAMQPVAGVERLTWEAICARAKGQAG